MKTDSNSLVNFTEAAAKKVKSLIDEEGNPELNLRVYVMGGGCSGFKYGFEFDTDIGHDDIVIEKEGVKLLIDPMSFGYLKGADIDYRDGLHAAFVIRNNPNTKTSCGCGSSFSA
jgi:iron-sulfur cluster insertion protein